MHDVFLDTDVILDLFLHREPHHSVALHLFSSLKKWNMQGLTSPVAIANIYYILSKARNRRYAIEKIRRLRRLVRIAVIDERIMDSAIRTPCKDFEDGIQYHCAVGNGADFLVTRNTADYPKNKLAVTSPVEYLRITAT